MKKILTTEQQAIRQQFQAHIDAEIRGDLDTTLSTMTSNPHLNNIPTLRFLPVLLCSFIQFKRLAFWHLDWLANLATSCGKIHFIT